MVFMHANYNNQDRKFIYGKLLPAVGHVPRAIYVDFLNVCYHKILHSCYVNVQRERSFAYMLLKIAKGNIGIKVIDIVCTVYILLF